MNRKLLAGLAAVALAFSLTACGPEPEEQCVDRNGTRYVCEDDDDDTGFIPFIVPWHSSSKPKAPSYKAPAYRAPSFKAPSYRAPSFRSK